MSLDDDFAQAQAQVQKLPARPDNATLLSLYALYKQGTEGDVSGKKPGALDFKGRAKYEAWEAKRGLTKDEAKKQYVAFAQKLVAGKA